MAHLVTHAPYESKKISKLLTFILPLVKAGFRVTATQPTQGWL